ncbi:MAG: hypothetical protein ACFFAN_17800, partial [Promethearchaeota archaeon]
RNLNFINEIKSDREDKINIELINSYKENFNFLFNDLLKLREIKIINAALALQEIEINHLIEAEKLYYQNLISVVKGYKKVKSISLYNRVDEGKIKRIMSKEINGTTEVEKAEEISQRTSIVDFGLFKAKAKEFNYTLIRFLKKTPALVGIDLINYGPFEKESIAFLPFKNAEILIFEKFAEKIDLS